MVSSYGCGKQGFIKSNCPDRSPSLKRYAADFKAIHLRTFSLNEHRSTLLRVKICGLTGIMGADTGASHTIAGETLFRLLREQGVEFEKTSMKVTLADGLPRETEVYMTQVEIEIQRRSFSITLFALPTAEDNRTLLGSDFLRSAGIVLYLPKSEMVFPRNTRKQFSFSKDYFRPSKRLKNAAEINMFLLRESEGRHLFNGQRSKLNKLLNQYVDIFQSGEELTPKVQHYIDTGSNPPVAVSYVPIQERIIKEGA